MKIRVISAELKALYNGNRRTKYRLSLEENRKNRRERYYREKLDPDKYSTFLIKSRRYKSTNRGRATHRAKEATK